MSGFAVTHLLSGLTVVSVGLGVVSLEDAVERLPGAQALATQPVAHGAQATRQAFRAPDVRGSEQRAGTSTRPADMERGGRVAAGDAWGGTAPAAPGGPVWRVSLAPREAAAAGCGDGHDPAVAGDLIALSVFERSTLAETPDGIADNRDTVMFERADLSQSHHVAADGALSLPAIGRVPAAGLPLACLEARVAAAMQSALGIDAAVTAHFAERPPVLVRGDVGAPGAYDFRASMSVARLLARAGYGRADAADAERLAFLDARRDELARLRASVDLEVHSAQAEVEGRAALDLDEAERARLAGLLGADRLNSESAALAAAQAARTARAERNAADLADMDDRIAAAREQLATATTQRDHYGGRRQALTAKLQEECRYRCLDGRGNVEEKLESATSRSMSLELLVLDKTDALDRLVAARAAREREIALKAADTRRDLSEQLRAGMKERNEIDAQLRVVRAQIADLGGGDDADAHVVIERRTAEGNRTFSAEPDTLLRPDDLLTVSRPTGIGADGLQAAAGAPPARVAHLHE